MVFTPLVVKTAPFSFRQHHCHKISTKLDNVSQKKYSLDNLNCYVAPPSLESGTSEYFQNKTVAISHSVTFVHKYNGSF